MYCSRLHTWWSTQSGLATLLSSLIARRWVGLQTLWWFRLKDLSIDEMVGAWCFGCLSSPPGFTCWISFARVFSFIYCWVLIFALSPCYTLIYMFWEMMHWWVRGLSCKPNNYLSWCTSELRVRLAPLNWFKPSSKTFYWPFQGGTFLWIFLCFCSVLCLLCLCARLFICALWSPAGKGLTSWLSFVVSNCEFVTFPLVPWVRCGTWLYRFLIFAPLLTLMEIDWCQYFVSAQLDRFWPNFVYELILTWSSLRLLPVIFLKFVIEFWPLIGVDWNVMNNRICPVWLTSEMNSCLINKWNTLELAILFSVICLEKKGKLWLVVFVLFFCGFFF